MGIGLSDFVHDFNNGAVALSLMDSGADIGLYKSCKEPVKDKFI